jgi:hypothetical protein
MAVSPTEGWITLRDCPPTKKAQPLYSWANQVSVMLRARTVCRVNLKPSPEVWFPSKQRARLVSLTNGSYKP